jgi:hypothetical protein
LRDKVSGLLGNDAGKLGTDDDQQRIGAGEET